MSGPQVLTRDELLVAAVAFLASALLTTIMCLAARPIGQFLGVMDMPTKGDGHKRHARPTPAVGGVILAIVGILAFSITTKFSAHGGTEDRFLHIACFGAILATMIVGLFDDRKHIPALIRLATSVVILTIMLLLVPNLELTHLEFPSINFRLDTGLLALPLTILCLVALKNAINMADGRNGLLLGMTLIWNTFFLLHAPAHMVPLILSLSGSAAVIFAFNVRGKLFSGDCGAYGIATYFGILALALHSSAYGTVKTAEIVLLFLIPVLDTCRLIIIRVAAGRSPLAPDRHHLHHLLERAIGWKRGWFVYMALIILPILTYQFIAGYGVPFIVATSGRDGLVVS